MKKIILAVFAVAVLALMFWQRDTVLNEVEAEYSCTFNSKVIQKRNRFTGEQKLYLYGASGKLLGVADEMGSMKGQCERVW